jgi:hypothetical protein
MPIKDLLVLADRAAPSRQRLEFALSVAQRLSANVTALALGPEPYLPTLEGVHIPLELVRQQLEEAEREADTILAAAQEAAGKRAVPLATGRITAPEEQMATLFARMARQTDLCVVGQPSEETSVSEAGRLAEAAFMDSGRPALVVPLSAQLPSLCRQKDSVCGTPPRAAHPHPITVGLVHELGYRPAADPPEGRAAQRVRQARRHAAPPTPPARSRASQPGAAPSPAARPGSPRRYPARGR